MLVHSGEPSDRARTAERCTNRTCSPSASLGVDQAESADEVAGRCGVADFDGDNVISASDIKVGLDLIVNYQDELTRVRPRRRAVHTPHSPPAQTDVHLTHRTADGRCVDRVSCTWRRSHQPCHLCIRRWNACVAARSVAHEQEAEQRRAATGMQELGLRETHDKMSPQALDQVVAKVLAEMDPRGRGVKFNDFRQVLTRMPDFLFNFRMTI